MPPKLPLLRLVVGSFNSVWLRMLKNSARSWKRICSCDRIGKKLLISAVSTLVRLGPRNEPFPRLPNVPIAGRAKYEVLSQGTQVAEPHPLREAADAVLPY